MSARVRGLEQENSALKYAVSLRDSEVARLCGELASQNKGASFMHAGTLTSHPEPAVLLGMYAIAATCFCSLVLGGHSCALEPSKVWYCAVVVLPGVPGVFSTC